MLPVVILCCLVFPVVLCRPEGAPTDACETMDPSHGGSPQTGPMPYTLLLDTYRTNSDAAVFFTIKAKPPHTFAGFMVQARSERDDKAIGRFTESDGVKLMECFGMPDNTATHTKNDPKQEVTMRWVADNGFSGKIIFHATVAKTMKEYWVKQQAKPLTVFKAKA